MFCHEVMLKLKPEYWKKHSIEAVNSALQAVQSDLSCCVFSAEAMQNCVVRDINYDILVKVRLDRKDSLEKYLNHPRHLSLSREFAQYLTEKAAVDYVLD